MKKNAWRQGITQELAIIIIIAVTISIAAAFISWVHSIITTSIKQPEILKIYSTDTAIMKQGNTWILRLHILNEGSSTARIYKIVIVGKESIETNIKIKPMQEKTVNITLTGIYAPHTLYTVRIYTESGNVYNTITTYIQAKQ